MSVYQEIAQQAVLASAIDGTTDAGPTAGIYTGSGGDIVVEMAQQGGGEITFVNTPAGAFLPISIRKWVSGPADALALFV